MEVDASDYVLMHREYPVAEVGLDEAAAAITKIGVVHAAERVPVGITVKQGAIDRAALNEWWWSRAIPASRQGIREALRELNVYAPQNLLSKSFGLSLSDQYWIRPASTDLKWAEINFFENPFSGDVGDILFGKDKSGAEISLLSPGNTSDGWLRKRVEMLAGVMREHSAHHPVSGLGAEVETDEAYSGEDEQYLLESNLPPYLKKDIVALEEGRRNNASLLDCLYCEVQGSINAAFHDREITEKQAVFLRKKYLGLESINDYSEPEDGFEL